MTIIEPHRTKLSLQRESAFDSGGDGVVHVLLINRIQWAPVLFGGETPRNNWRTRGADSFQGRYYRGSFELNFAYTHLIGDLLRSFFRLESGLMANEGGFNQDLLSLTRLQVGTSFRLFVETSEGPAFEFGALMVERLGFDFRTTGRARLEVGFVAASHTEHGTAQTVSASSSAVGPLLAMDTQTERRPIIAGGDQWSTARATQESPCVLPRRTWSAKLSGVAVDPHYTEMRVTFSQPLSPTMFGVDRKATDFAPIGGSDLAVELVEYWQDDLNSQLANSLGELDLEATIAAQVGDYPLGEPEIVFKFPRLTVVRGTPSPARFNSAYRITMHGAFDEDVVVANLNRVLFQWKPLAPYSDAGAVFEDKALLSSVMSVGVLNTTGKGFNDADFALMTQVLQDGELMNSPTTPGFRTIENVTMGISFLSGDLLGGAADFSSLSIAMETGELYQEFFGNLEDATQETFILTGSVESPVQAVILPTCGAAFFDEASMDFVLFAGRHGPVGVFNGADTGQVSIIMQSGTFSAPQIKIEDDGSMSFAFQDGELNQTIFEIPGEDGASMGILLDAGFSTEDWQFTQSPEPTGPTWIDQDGDGFEQVRWNALDSNVDSACPGWTGPGLAERQMGTAFKRINLDNPGTLRITVTGLAERHTSNFEALFFDSCRVRVNSVEKIHEHGSTESLNCLMRTVNGTVDVALPYGVHEIEVDCDSGDNLHHVDLHFVVKFEVI